MTRRRWIADEVSGNRAALSVLMPSISRKCFAAALARNSISRPVKTSAAAASPASPTAGSNLNWAKLFPPLAMPNLTLLLSIFKFDRMEWAIEKCVELGVARIVPVVAQRTEAHLATAAQKRVERWQRIALQASEQSRRAVAAGNLAADQAQGGGDAAPAALASCWPNRKNR